MKIIISDGNSKLGRIPNLSLIPVKDCGNCDYCMADCYALKAWKRYPNTRAAWKQNSVAFRSDPFGAARKIALWFKSKRKPPPYFRIHVAGDFLTKEHFAIWSWLADWYPDTKFLAFTKMHQLINMQIVPDNMQIIFSQWPGMSDHSPQGARRAWLQDGTEDRISKGAFECSGSCIDCKTCFDDGHKDIVFMMH